MKNMKLEKPLYDFILKSEEIDNLPTDVTDGSTAYVVDTKACKIFYAGQWWDM